MAIKRFLLVMAAAIAISGYAAAQSKTVTIGATLMDAKNQWFQWVMQGMQEAAKKYGAVITVVNTQGNPSAEVSTVEDFVQKKVDAIVVGAASPTASANALTTAQKGGIKIIAYNSLVGKEGQFPFVGVDNKQLGALNGKAAKDYINSKLGGKAKVAVIYTPKYGAISLARSDGFEEVIKTIPGAPIVARQIAEDQEVAQNMVQNILTAHPDVNVVFCWNESSFKGALAAIKAAGKTKQIKVFGVDMSPTVTQAFRTEEDIGAVVTQEPVDIGYTAVEEAIRAVRGTSIPADTRVPVKLVTNANLDEFLKTHPYYSVQ